MRKRRAESRKGMVVTTVALEEDLHRRLAIAALDDKAAITELAREAVREWLDRREVRNRRRGHG
jgi:predicted transcriptional regulator